MDDLEGRAKRFLAAVAALGARGRTTAYPAELRREALAYAEQAQRGGVSLRAAATTLGLSADSLRHWRAARPPRAQRRGRILRAVTTEASAAVVSRTGALVVTMPGGVRIEGLDVAGLADLVRRLA